jgi:hypothetical protein
VTGLTSAVDEAVAAVQAHFAGHPVEVIPDGTDGVFVIIGDVDVGGGYTPRTTWLGFQVSSAYPQSDVYPYYTGRVTRSDGRPHGEGVQEVNWQGRSALQLSRRSNRWNPAVDNAVLKAERVIRWFGMT